MLEDEDRGSIHTMIHEVQTATIHGMYMVYIMKSWMKVALASNLDCALRRTTMIC